VQPILIVTMDPYAQDALETAIAAHHLPYETLPGLTLVEKRRWENASLILLDHAAAVDEALDLPCRTDDATIIIYTRAEEQAPADAIAELYDAPYTLLVPSGLRWLSGHLALHAAPAV
jgi:hypothetical protein